MGLRPTKGDEDTEVQANGRRNRMVSSTERSARARLTVALYYNFPHERRAAIRLVMVIPNRRGYCRS